MEVVRVGLKCWLGLVLVRILQLIGLVRIYWKPHHGLIQVEGYESWMRSLPTEAIMADWNQKIFLRRLDRFGIGWWGSKNKCSDFSACFSTVKEHTVALRHVLISRFGTFVFLLLLNYTRVISKNTYKNLGIFFSNLFVKFDFQAKVIGWLF